MLLLCRADIPTPNAPVTPALPGEVLRGHYLATGRSLVAICDVGFADLTQGLESACAASFLAAPIELGLVRDGDGKAFTVMLHLAWDAAARALDGLWPEVVQALRVLETPFVTGAYRLAAQQEAVIFVEVNDATELNHLAALRLFHGVAMESVTLLGSPLKPSS